MYWDLWTPHLTGHQSHHRHSTDQDHCVRYAAQLRPHLEGRIGRWLQTRHGAASVGRFQVWVWTAEHAQPVVTLPRPIDETRVFCGLPLGTRLHGQAGPLSLRACHRTNQAADSGFQTSAHSCRRSVLMMQERHWLWGLASDCSKHCRYCLGIHIAPLVSCNCGTGCCRHI